MNEWKEAYWLTRLEFKRMNIGLFIVILLFLMPAFFFLTHFLATQYFNHESLTLDFVFLFFFAYLSKSIWPIYTRQKNYELKDHIAGLSQLPIQKEIIVKQRFLVDLFVSVPIQVTLLIILYIGSPSISTKVSPMTYIIFSFIWLCFSVYVGSMFVTFIAGFTMKEVLLYTVIGFALIFSIVIIEAYPYMTFETDWSFPPTMDQSFLSIEWEDNLRGYINWTMVFAEKQPVLSIIVSLLLAIVGCKLWMNRMARTIERTDYLK